MSCKFINAPFYCIPKDRDLSGYEKAICEYKSLDMFDSEGELKSPYKEMDAFNLLKRLRNTLIEDLISIPPILPSSKENRAKTQFRSVDRFGIPFLKYPKEVNNKKF